MREFFCFWWRCTKFAKKGTVPLARSWWLLLGIPVGGFVRYIAGGRVAEMILPNHPILDPIIDGVIFTFVGFAAVCIGAFVIKLLNAPVTFDQQATARMDAVNAEEKEQRRVQTEAIQRQTEEMRRQREQREREIDPSLSAFRENRRKFIEAGGVVDDQRLDQIVWWIAAKSAWGRWQAAEWGIENMSHIGLLIAGGNRLLQFLESGAVIIRARREGKSSYEELAPDFWRYRHLSVDSDPIRNCAVSIRLRDEDADADRYVDPCCDLNRIKELLPEQDEQLEAAIADILTRRNQPPA
jgi:hypothetical protein